MGAIINFYNEFYQKKPHPFGIQPTQLAKKLVHYLSPRSLIVDAGAGDGRNTLFFLKRGFSVDAIEPSSAAQKLLKLQTKYFSRRLDQIPRDIINVPTSKKADAVLFSFIFHHLKRGEALTVIKKYQKAIPIHAISVFTNQSVFAKKSTHNFFPSRKDIETFYKKGWEILYLEIKNEVAAQKQNGSPIVNQTLHFIARKIVEGHGGTISGKSDGEDKGSTFMVKLPKVRS